MTIWTLFLILLALGALVWLIEQAPFVSATVKPFLRWVVLLVIVLIVLNALGALDWAKSTRIGGH